MVVKNAFYCTRRGIMNNKTKKPYIWIVTIMKYLMSLRW